MPNPIETNKAASSMDALINLVYMSRAQSAFATREARHQLKIQASSYNATHHITGLLIFSQGFFLQILEGPETQVDDLYTRISADPRHGDIVLLTRTMISIRHFSEWALGIVDTEDTANHHLGVAGRLAAINVLRERAHVQPVSGRQYVEAFLDPLLVPASAE